MEKNNFIATLRRNADKCRNMYELCLKVGITSIGGETYREIRKIAEENNIVLLFNGESKRVVVNNKKKGIGELLCNGSSIKSDSLKKKLLDEGYKEYKCECCGNTEWNGKPIPLELHHINGIHNDNRIENLQLLCRNCHGQTENFCGKNTTKNKRVLRPRRVYTTKKDTEIYVNKRYLIDLLYTNSLKNVATILDITKIRLMGWLKVMNIRVSNNWYNELIDQYPDRYGVCKNCGKRFIKKTSSQTFCSQECAKHNSEKIKITKEELLAKLKIYKSFLQTSKYFGVSDKCISKWCKRFEIPSKKKELTEYLKNI